MSNLLRMTIAPVREGDFMAEVMLADSTSAASKPFASVDEATAWAIKYADEAGSKAADQDFSPEVKAGIHSIGGVPLEDTVAE